MDTNQINVKQLLERGVRSGDYNIIGRGGFGIVIEGMYKGDRVAVKVMHEKYGWCLRNERRVMDLSHPSLINIISTIWDRNSYYVLVIMERFSCTTLRDGYLAGMPTISRYRYLIDVLNGLQHLHSNRVVHLDVKPNNILIDRTKVCAKLSDFGSCVKIGTTFIQTPQVTTHYAAPEIYSSRFIATNKCDMYSLGITMWELLTKQIPFQGWPKPALLHKVIHEKKRPDESVYEKGYSELYRRCWKESPEERPDSSTVLQGIVELLRSSTTH